MADRPYLFYELTNAVCSKCLRKVEAKVTFEDDKVFLVKRCPTHKLEKVLISTDIEYYKLCRRALKPGQLPLKFNTAIERGCPYDCGLCPDHEQHSCVAVVEINDACNLTCPVCYAESSPKRTESKSLEEVNFLLDSVVRNEGRPDVVQISGGEPTIHPELFSILDLAKSKPIKHLMLNTNGIRIAEDEVFAERLSEYAPGFEIYLQFDGLDDASIRSLRGADLWNIRRRALDRLNKLELSTTLVVTLKKGVNDESIGAMIDFALGEPCVRGITFQPIQAAGRAEDYDPARDRLTVSEIRSMIAEQSRHFGLSDIVPVPCHPDCLAMAYALKLGGKVVPLTRMLEGERLTRVLGNTIVNEQDPELRQRALELFSTAHSPESAAHSVTQLLCCLPDVEFPGQLNYANVFRILIVQFMDAYNLDIRSVKKSCVHIVHADGRLIPFDNYNIFYRDRRVLAGLFPAPELVAIG